MLSSLLICCYCSVRPTQTACGRLSQVSLEGVIFDSGFVGRCYTVGMVGRYTSGFLWGVRVLVVLSSVFPREAFKSPGYGKCGFLYEGDGWGIIWP